MACTYKIKGNPKVFNENEFKQFLLDGGLQKLIDSKLLTGIELPSISSSNKKSNDTQSNIQRTEGGQQRTGSQRPPGREESRSGQQSGNVGVREATSGQPSEMLTEEKKSSSQKTEKNERGKNNEGQSDQKTKESRKGSESGSGQKNVQENDVLESKGAETQEPKAPSSSEERRFTKQLLKDQGLAPGALEGIRKTLEYVKQTNALSVADAERIMKEAKPEDVYDIVVNNKDIKPAVRVVLGQALIKKFNELASQATNEENKNYYIDKTIDIATYVTEKLATESGQMIQSFSLYSRLSPEAQLRDAIKNQKKAADEQKKKQSKTAQPLTEKLQKVNEETAEKITNSKSLDEKIKKTENKRVQNAKDKIEQARNKRKSIIDKYNKNKGTSLYSTIGLTTEGIEFVGDLIATYIKEGFYQAEIIADKVLSDLKSIINKEPNDRVKMGVSSIVQQMVYDQQNKIIADGLKELENKVKKIIKQHYTVSDDQRKTLTSKLLQIDGLSQEDAAALAKDIETEFDRIASRKKQEVLLSEKRRFDKIKSGLGAKRNAPTLQDELIRYTNLGAFDNAQLVDMLAEKLGTGTLTAEETNRIQDLAQKVQNAPEGSPKREATEDLLAYQAKLGGKAWGDIVQGLWYANVLSGYKTQVKNFVANTFNSMAILGIEFLKNPKSLPFLLAGAGHGIKRGGIEGLRTLKTGRSPIHNVKIEIPSALERTSFLGGGINPANWAKYVTRVMVAADVFAFQGLKELRATQLAYREAAKEGNKNPLSKQTWKVVNDKLLNTQERYDDALAQVQSEGLKGLEAKRRIYELMEASRPIQMTEDAYGFAAKGTFNHDTEGTLGALTNAVSAALDVPVGGVRPFRFLVPFTKIITNVANNMMDYSPIGLIRGARGVRGFKSFDDYRFTKGTYHQMTVEERATTILKASMGIALTAGLYALTKIKGDDDEPIIEITGGGTGNFKKDAQLKEEGWRPYSIKYNGKYYSYALTPLMLNLGFLGNLNDYEKYNKDADEEDALNKTMLSLYQSGKMISDMTWIGSTSSIMSALASDNPEQIGNGIANSLQNAGKGFLVPNIYTQSAQAAESIFNLPKKEAKGFFQNLIKDVPIARNKLNDKINALGDPVMQQNDFLTSTKKEDKIWNFLLDKKGWVSPVNRGTIVVFDQNTKQDRPITDDEYYNFSKLRGHKIKEQLNKIMSNGLIVETEDGEIIKSKEEITPTDLSKALTKIAKNATKESKEELFGETPKKEKYKVSVNE